MPSYIGNYVSRLEAERDALRALVRFACQRADCTNPETDALIGMCEDDPAWVQKNLIPKGIQLKE